MLKSFFSYKLIESVAVVRRGCCVLMRCQVFTMDMPELSVMYYAATKTEADSAGLEHCAEQLATLCATLGEYPLIRYQ